MSYYNKTNKNQLKATKEILDTLGIRIVKVSSNKKEIICHCPLSDCDSDSGHGEGHFYMNEATTQWHCFKCGESGNAITLCKRLHKSLNIIFYSDQSFGRRYF